MLNGIGFLVVIVAVFGGFALSGGNVFVVMKALPHELLVIGGGALGAFLVANSKHVLLGAGKGIRHVFKGARWSGQDYMDLLSLLFTLIRIIRSKGGQALESHIENPAESPIFAAYPRLLEDKHLIDFICDYLRMMTLELNNPHYLSEVVESDMERLHAEEMQPQLALQTMADGLPAIGIVAAVLGVIKTMGSIDQPTEILGAMIGSALVGTFLGVLLSYTVVGPLAARLSQIIDEESKVYQVIRATLVAHLQGMSPGTAIEIGRRAVPSLQAPSFTALEERMDELSRSGVAA